MKLLIAFLCLIGFTAAAQPIIRNNVTTNPLAPGTTGQFLGANTGSAPTWQTPAGSGTVTTLSVGNLNPIFSASVANPTTTPSVTFTVVASTNLGAGTNFDCKSASFGYRGTTNTSIAFQLTNETDGLTSAILLFNQGATPPALITISPSTGRTNIYVAGQASYAPSSNATTKIVIEQYPSNNVITFIDNYH